MPVRGEPFHRVALAQARVGLAVGDVRPEAAVAEHDRPAGGLGAELSQRAAGGVRPRRLGGSARRAASSSVTVKSCSSLSRDRDSEPLLTYGP